MLYRIVFFFIFFPLLVSAQLQVDKTVYDHGNIAVFNNDTAWFTFSNNGTKEIFLLPTMPNDDYAILCSERSILPGGIMQMGIVFYTGKKGSFEKKIPLYFSNSNNVTTLTIKGNIKSISETAFNTCPSIENSKPLQPNQIPLKVTVRDFNTHEILSPVKVEVIRKNSTIGCVPGYESKSYKCNVPYGPLQISASKKGYQSDEVTYDYDNNNYHCEILLKQIIDTVEIIDRRYSSTEIETRRDSIVNEEFPVYVPVAYADSGFNSYKYKPNHLIFIVDVSGSMRDSTKLEYLKKSMKALIAIIRPGDYITLITYNTKVNIVFENKSGLDKKTIEMAIDTLKAAGGSNGSKSLVIAYELARKYFIPNGNNQVFISTDGILNSSSMSNEDLYKLASKAWRQDKIILSTIGFGKDAKAISFLQKLAKSGHGNFLQILNTNTDINTLIEEVKNQSKI